MCVSFWSPDVVFFHWETNVWAPSGMFSLKLVGIFFSPWPLVARRFYLQRVESCVAYLLPLTFPLLRFLLSLTFSR